MMTEKVVPRGVPASNFPPAVMVGAPGWEPEPLTGLLNTVRRDLERSLSPIAFGGQTIFRSGVSETVKRRNVEDSRLCAPASQRVYLFVCNRQIPKELSR